jgi:hypothetical protein
VIATLNLDGDGKLEVVVGSMSYEGEAITIYRCEPKKLEALLSVSCGVCWLPMTIDAKVLVASAFVLIANCFGSSLNAEEMIKNKSPDGKFALQLTHGEEGWETAIVALPSKKKSST